MSEQKSRREVLLGSTALVALGVPTSIRAALSVPGPVVQGGTNPIVVVPTFTIVPSAESDTNFNVAIYPATSDRAGSVYNVRVFILTLEKDLENNIVVKQTHTGVPGINSPGGTFSASVTMDGPTNPKQVTIPLKPLDASQSNTVVYVGVYNEYQSNPANRRSGIGCFEIMK